jgi:hypothetical protein
VPSIYNISNYKLAVSRKINRNCVVFANGCWEMLLKAIGQQWGTLKGYRKATGEYAKVIGQPLGNS